MLISTFVGSLFAVLVTTAVQPPLGCDPNLAAAGLCGTNTGSEIVVDGTQTTEGDPGYEPISDDWAPPSDVSDGVVTPGKRPPTALDECVIDWDSYLQCFRAAEKTEEEDAEEETSATIPSVTISDLARFAPDGSVIVAEPDNVGVVGLPTNFVAEASTQTVTGELFGFPLSVRFTPAAYDFSYGDGSKDSFSSGGETWASLAQAQFTPTDTSHTYSERGTYDARVDVRYTAEIDFGVGWFPIAGQVTSTGSPQEVRIFEAHTALVAHTCAQAPSSPGC